MNIVHSIRKATTTLAAIALLGTASFSQAGIIQYGAILSGDQEVPPVVTTGNGNALVTFDDVSNLLTWSLTFFDMAGPVVAAHIHNAPMGSNGGVITDLAGGGAIVSGIGSSEGVFFGTTTLTAPQATELANGNLYFNLHTPVNPGGEIRGQILPASVIIDPVDVPAPAAFLLIGLAAAAMSLTRRMA